MLLGLGLGPMIDFYVRNRVVGDEIFDTLEHPVIFVANHSSHLDTPTILRALPPKWRRRTAVTAAADYFYKTRLKASRRGAPVQHRAARAQGRRARRRATDHVDRLIDEAGTSSCSPRAPARATADRPGAFRCRGIAAQHGIDMVPIYLSGTHEAMPPGQNWPKRIPGRLFSRRHEVEVRFGDPIRPRDADDRREVMDEVRAFWEPKGPAARPAPVRARVEPEVVLAR